MKNQRRKNQNENEKKLSQIFTLLIGLLTEFGRWIGEKLKFSIRFKLALNHIRILVGAMIAASLGVIILFGSFQIYKAVSDDYTTISTILELDNRDYTELGTFSEEHGIPVSIYNQDEGLLFASHPELADRGYKPHAGVVWTDQSFYLAVNWGQLSSRLPAQVIVYSDIRQEITMMREISLIILTVFSVVAFFSIISIAFSGRGFLEPIKEMTQTVKHISERNLNLRLNVSGSKNELKELALTFNEMMNRIEGYYNRQRQFVSDASHELRTPIAVIQGYTVMLDRWGKNDPEVLQEAIAAIKNESENMKELIDKLLFLARHDKDTFVFEKEEFSLTEMLLEIGRETQIIDSFHNLLMEINKEVSIYADRNRIKQAIRVLIDNAIKYTPAGGDITISLKTDNDTISVSIKDTGIGMSEEELKHVFDRFYRTDESRTKEKGGHGLGLAIAKIIILGHGGKIKVKSKVGEGSEFLIILKQNHLDS